MRSGCCAGRFEPEARRRRRSPESSALIPYKGGAAGEDVVQGAAVGVEFLGHPVDRSCPGEIGRGINGVDQRAPRSLSAYRRIHEQVLEVTDVRRRPARGMKQIMGEA